MHSDVAALRAQAEADIAAATDPRSLDAFRVKYLARKGSVAALFDRLKTAPAGDRPALGKLLNELRNAVQELHDARVDRDAVFCDHRDRELLVAIAAPIRGVLPIDRHVQLLTSKSTYRRLTPRRM